jgi:DNA-binding beta-propeller fold protein YncE
MAMPSGSKGGNVIIVTPEGTAVSQQAIAIPGPPQIAHVDPAQAEPETVITITGSNFDLAAPSNNRVRFNDLQASAIKAYNDGGTERVEVKVPLDARDGNIVVETPSGTSTAQLFRVIPRIVSFRPTEGTIGSEVTIYGKGFFDRNLQVLFGDQTVTPVSVVPNPGGEDTVLFRVPSGSPDHARVGVVLGPGREAKSPFEFQISRFDELKGLLRAREASYEDRTTSEVLRIDCDKGDYVEIIRTKPKSGTVSVSTGQCPADIAVDQPNHHAYVVNSKSNTITSIDLLSDKQDGTFPTGGAQSVRIVLVHGKLPFWVTDNRRLMWPNPSNPSGPPEERAIDGEFSGIYAGNEGGPILISVRPNGALIATPVGPSWNKDCEGRGTEVAQGRKISSAANMQRIYIANFASNTITKIPFTCRPTPERIELEDGAQPITLAVHPDQVVPSYGSPSLAANGSVSSIPIMTA